jgi:hypothetical protein
MTHLDMVTSIVREHGPVTDQQIYYFAAAKSLPEATRESLRTRRSEAVKAGLVREAGPVVNKRGRQVRTWVAA